MARDSVAFSHDGWVAAVSSGGDMTNGRVWKSECNACTDVDRKTKRRKRLCRDYAYKIDNVMTPSHNGRGFPPQSRASEHGRSPGWHLLFSYGSHHGGIHLLATSEHRGLPSWFTRIRVPASAVELESPRRHADVDYRRSMERVERFQSLFLFQSGDDADSRGRQDAPDSVDRVSKPAPVVLREERIAGESVPARARRAAGTRGYREDRGQYGVRARVPVGSAGVEGRVSGTQLELRQIDLGDVRPAGPAGLAG